MKTEAKNKIIELNEKIEILTNELYEEVIKQEKIIYECVDSGLLPNTLKHGSTQQTVSFSLPTHPNYIRNNNSEIKEYIKALIQKTNEQKNNIDNW